MKRRLFFWEKKDTTDIKENEEKVVFWEKVDSMVAFWQLKNTTYSDEGI